MGSNIAISVDTHNSNVLFLPKKLVYNIYARLFLSLFSSCVSMGVAYVGCAYWEERGWCLLPIGSNVMSGIYAYVGCAYLEGGGSSTELGRIFSFHILRTYFNVSVC